MNIDAAKKITGWMNEHELLWLAERAEKALCVAEIGSAYGRSTRALADNDAGLIYSIDTWKGSPDELTTTHKPYADRKGDEVYIQFLENLWDRILLDQVFPMRMDSENAASLFAKKGIKFDFVFIDGDHSRAGLTKDIQDFLPLLATNGVFAGHDYNNSNWPVVTQVVNEIFPSIKNPVSHIWQAVL
jgi:predicted O-methyltransferase YrrM